MLFSEVQPAKVEFPIYSTPSGIVIETSADPLNAPTPIFVTLSGIVIEARLLQLANAS